VFNDTVFQDCRRRPPNVRAWSPGGGAPGRASLHRLTRWGRLFALPRRQHLRGRLNGPTCRPLPSPFVSRTSELHVTPAQHWV